MVNAPSCWRRRGPTRRRAGQFWVATDRCATVVATVGWRPLGPAAAALERLYVHRRWRRQGVAAALAAFVEAGCRDRGASTVELWSDTRFVDAHRFYLSRGYRRAGADRELHDASRTVEHHFVKDLTTNGGTSPEA